MFENKDITECAEILKADLKNGLKLGEVSGRLHRDGRNEMREPRKKTVIENFFSQLNDPLIYVLLVAAVVSILLHEVSDAVIVVVSEETGTVSIACDGIMTREYSIRGLKMVLTEKLLRKRDRIEENRDKNEN